MQGRYFAIVAAVVAGAALVVGASAPAVSQNKPRLYIGSLSCNVSGGGGFLFGSSNQLSCV